MNLSTLKSKPSVFLLLFAILLLLTPFFVEDQTFDIHLSDTFYVIGISLIYWVFSAALLLLWIMYRLIHLHLYSRLLSWLHILLTIIVMFIIAVVPWWSGYFSNAPKRFTDTDVFVRRADYTVLNNSLVLLLCTLLVVQLIFLVNIIIGIFTRRS